MRIFALIVFLVSLVFLGGSVLHFSRQVQCEFSAVRLRFLLDSLEKELKGRRSGVQKMRLAAAYRPYLAAAREGFLSKAAYWKEVFNPYLDVASTYGYENKGIPALKYIKTSLGYHPYHANSYGLAADMYSLVGIRERSNVCRRVKAKLLAGADDRAVLKAEACECLRSSVCDCLSSTN